MGFLGVDLWEREVEIVQAIKSYRRTAIKACHGVGKTFTLAVSALWWLARYPEGIVLYHLAYAAAGTHPALV